ncbi:cytochrome C oxidase subunit II [Gordonia iterans]|uniref:cytochrome-c oxidase n=1 Tax=Gordonia iterans TaxID=1004901 RepID=A0A2S0KH89_9ACTN|nr:cytochrome c oxidase subunit II [Gordonia iterans]AVM01033.1 cytochrome C oxidase subunit II [Gordonia iterans]
MKLTHGGRSSARRNSGASRTVKRLGALGALALAALVTSGCSPEEAVRFGWPSGITPPAKEMLHLWQWACIAALIMGVFVWGLIFWTITFHRRKGNKDATATDPAEELPRQTGYNVPLELAYTAVPFVMIAVLFYFTVMVQTNVERKEPNPPVVVDVTAFQWNWKFGYNTVRLADGTELVTPADAKKGSPFDLQDPEYYEHDGHEVELPGPAGGKDADVRDYLTFDKIETLGTSSEIPILVLPTDTRIQFDLASADVVHSFWVPEFLYKRDVMPFPKENHQDPSFQIEKIERPGAFVGRCAEMCGTYHAMMNFEVRAVSPEVFEAYIKYRLANPEKNNAEALSAVCQQPQSVVTVPFDTRRVATTDTPEYLGDANDTTIPNCTLPQSQEN